MLQTQEFVQDGRMLQVNEALSDRPADKVEYSMRQEQEQVLKVGARIVACLAKYALSW